MQNGTTPAVANLIAPQQANPTIFGVPQALFFSRMLMAMVLTMCGMVLYVVHHQGVTIEQQRVLIREMYFESLKHPTGNAQVAAPAPAASPAAETTAPKPAGDAQTIQDGCFYGACV